MTNSALNDLENLEDELLVLQAKLVDVESKKLLLFQMERGLRGEMRKILNQISRLKQLHEKAPDGK